MNSISPSGSEKPTVILQPSQLHAVIIFVPDLTTTPHCPKNYAYVSEVVSSEKVLKTALVSSFSQI
jgi:hypothetical protein